MKILLIDDDTTLLDGLEHLISSEGYLVDRAENSTDAANMVKCFAYDLLVVDWNLPDGNGPDLIESLRRKKYNGPILMLTANDSLPDKEHGFRKGADDYLCKPFEPREFRARVNALLRRAERNYSESLTLGNIELNLATQRLYIDRTEMVLQPQEYSVLQLLLKHPGEFFNNEQLLKRLWPSESESGVETVRTTVYKLRKKISGINSSHEIETQYKLGYRLTVSQPVAAKVPKEREE